MSRGIGRRDLLLATAALPLAMPSARAAVIPAAHNLRDELASALANQQPLVVMVSLNGCPFCKVARDNYLYPMHEQDRLPVAQIDMGSRTKVVDFRGNLVTHDDMARLWKIRVAPTVLFFGRGGVEVAERLVGGYIPDFYGAYLDERLLQARHRVK